MPRYKKAKSTQEIDMARQNLRSASLLMRNAEMALTEYIRKASKKEEQEELQQAKTVSRSKR